MEKSTKWHFLPKPHTDHEVHDITSSNKGTEWVAIDHNSVKNPGPYSTNGHTPPQIPAPFDTTMVDFDPG
jgi:hypothetical protein